MEYMFPTISTTIKLDHKAICKKCCSFRTQTFDHGWDGSHFLLTLDIGTENVMLELRPKIFFSHNPKNILESGNF